MPSFSFNNTGSYILNLPTFPSNTWGYKRPCTRGASSWPFISALMGNKVNIVHSRAIYLCNWETTKLSIFWAELKTFITLNFYNFYVYVDVDIDIWIYISPSLWIFGNYIQLQLQEMGIHFDILYLFKMHPWISTDCWSLRSTLQ